MKLTSTERKLLSALQDGALGVCDLGDKAKNSHEATHRCLINLRDRDLVHWLYPEDEACISQTGREALGEKG